MTCYFSVVLVLDLHGLNSKPWIEAATQEIAGALYYGGDPRAGVAYDPALGQKVTKKRNGLVDRLKALDTGQSLPRNIGEKITEDRSRTRESARHRTPSKKSEWPRQSEKSHSLPRRMPQKISKSPQISVPYLARLAFPRMQKPGNIRREHEVVQAKASPEGPERKASKKRLTVHPNSIKPQRTIVQGDQSKDKSTRRVIDQHDSDSGAEKAKIRPASSQPGPKENETDPLQLDKIRSDPHPHERQNRNCPRK